MALLVCALFFALVFLLRSLWVRAKAKIHRRVYSKAMEQFASVVVASRSFHENFNHLEYAEPLRRHEIIRNIIAANPEFSKVDSEVVCQTLKSEEDFQSFLTYLASKFPRDEKSNAGNLPVDSSLGDEQGPSKTVHLAS